MADANSYPIDDVKEPLASLLKKEGVLAPKIVAKFESIDPDFKETINKYDADNKVVTTVDKDGQAVPVTEEITGSYIRRALSIILADKFTAEAQPDKVKALKEDATALNTYNVEIQKVHSDALRKGKLSQDDLVDINTIVTNFVKNDDRFADVRDQIVPVSDSSKVTQEIADKNYNLFKDATGAKYQALSDKIDQLQKSGPKIRAALNRELIKQEADASNDQQRQAYSAEIQQAISVVVGHTQYNKTHPQKTASSTSMIDFQDMPFMPKKDNLASLLAGDEKQKLSEALKGVKLGSTVSLAGLSMPSLPLKAMNDAAAKKHPLAMKKANAFIG